jgi:xylulokinase
VRVSIGIDLGSSRIKLLALDETGECLGISMASYPTDSRRAGYAEQNPDRWWDALRLAMSELLARPALRDASVEALGMTGQMHGAVFLDAAGSAVRPALIWSDGRADAEAARSLHGQPFQRQLHGPQDHVGRQPRGRDLG